MLVSSSTMHARAFSSALWKDQTESISAYILMDMTNGINVLFFLPITTFLSICLDLCPQRIKSIIISTYNSIVLFRLRHNKGATKSLTSSEDFSASTEQVKTGSGAVIPARQWSRRRGSPTSVSPLAVFFIPTSAPIDPAVNCCVSVWLSAKT